MLRTLLSRYQANSSKLRHDSYRDRPKHIQKSVPENEMVKKEGKLNDFLNFFNFLKNKCLQIKLQKHINRIRH